MTKKRRRHATACKFRIALEALEGSKTIRQILSYQTMAEKRFVLCLAPAPSTWTHSSSPVLLSEDWVSP
ncbi:MAG: hypothetical protein OXO50_05935 [Caldilineaceae bacterium]|nr:hypothetical protein [Caldilineaceae bacterium]